jgi:transposase
MVTTRRFFTDEFKAEAVALLESSGRLLEPIARELGIQPSMLRAWRKRLRRSAEPPQPSRSQAAVLLAASDPAAEIARLKRENERLRMEKEILKMYGPPPVRKHDGSAMS